MRLTLRRPVERGCWRRDRLEPFFPNADILRLQEATDGFERRLTCSGACLDDGEWWRLYPLACDAFHRACDDWLVQDGYITVAPPRRDGDDYVIAYAPADDGRAALDCVKGWRAWCLDARAPSREKTEHFFEVTVFQQPHWPSNPVLDAIEATTHPDLADIRSRITPYRIERWMALIQETTDPNSHILRQAMHLDDDPYRLVKAEAFWHKIRIWKPQNVRQSGAN